MKFNLNKLFLNKQIILEEILKIRGLMQLLMKKRNTGIEWTRYELAKIKFHFKRLSKAIPFFILFLLPGGLLLIGLLVVYIDRRRRRRNPLNKEQS